LGEKELIWIGGNRPCATPRGGGEIWELDALTVEKKVLEEEERKGTRSKGRAAPR